MSFREVLAQLDDAHQRELASQGERYEDELCKLRSEMELLRSRLHEASRQSLSLDPPVDPSAGLLHTETAAEQQPAEAEAGNTAEGSAGLGPDTAAVTGDVPRFGPRWLWEVVGGRDKVGILAREGESTNSPQLASRLSIGALVEEIKLIGDRLHFKRLTGSGPQEGWISARVHGKDLAVRAGRAPLKLRQPPPMAVGPNSEEPLPIALLFHDALIPQGSVRTCLDMPVVGEMLDKARPILDALFGQGFSFESVLTSPGGEFICALIALERLKDQQPNIVRRAAAVAGMGTGLIAALCAAGALSFEDGLKLMVHIAKALKAQSGRLAKERMIAVRGLEHEELQLLCLQACEAEGKSAVCQITAFLSPQAYHVAGTAAAVDMVWEMAAHAGAQLADLFQEALGTELAAHKEAAFAACLYKVLPNMRPPLHSIWMMTTAEPVRPGCDPASIVDQLQGVVTSPMLAWQCIDAMRREGIREFYQLAGAMPPARIGPRSEAEWAQVWSQPPPAQPSARRQ